MDNGHSARDSQTGVGTSETERALAAATDAHQAGRLEEAQAAYQAILSAHPDQPGALHGLAILTWQRGLTAPARGYAERAAGLAPSEWRPALTAGLLAQACGDLPAARRWLRRACELQPDQLEAWSGLGSACAASDDHADAITAYEHALHLAPDDVNVLNNLGVSYEAAGQAIRAVSLYRHGLTLQPQSLPLYNNLGNALLSTGQAREAAAVLERGLLLAPEQPELWFNYGNALAAQQASTLALDAYRKALALAPDNLRAWVNLGNTHKARSEWPAAIQAYRRAIAAAPAYADAYNNLGVVLLRVGDVDGAIDALERAIALAPNVPVAYNNLGNAFKDTGRMDDALDAYRWATALAPHDACAHSNLLYALYFLPGCSEADILKEARQWDRQHAAPLLRQPATRAVPPHQRLRIGYVSPDFRDHCQALFTVPLLSQHDHQAFEIYCYADLACPDAVSERLRGYADVWRPIYGLSDAGVDALIRRDSIDILVDLTMHMSNGRPLLFAGKPAPVQVAWLAYPGTTGQTAIDYRLTDPWLDPPGSDDSRYTERTQCLPDTFWCYDPLTQDVEVNALPARTAGHLTFGCLNNFCKVSDETLSLWAQVLRQVPDSQLVLLAAPGRHRARVTDRLGQAGIAAQRVTFVPFQPRADYLRTYHRIDICLDTLPYNGHTTSLDAYWMGVPVVTRVGDTIVGRAGWSQLNNLGLTELAAWDDEAFVQTAVDLARDLPRLVQLRQGLRQRLQDSPLMDAPRFARAMESTYRALWAAAPLIPDPR